MKYFLKMILYAKQIQNSNKSSLYRFRQLNILFHFKYARNVANMNNCSINLLSSSTFVNYKCLQSFVWSILLYFKITFQNGFYTWDLISLKKISANQTGFLFSQLLLGTILSKKKKLHPITKGEDPDFRHHRIPMPNFF